MITLSHLTPTYPTASELFSDLLLEHAPSRLVLLFFKYRYQPPEFWKDHRLEYTNMRGPELKRCLRQQDKWSDLFNPFFAGCNNDFWKEFERDPQLLEAYEICHRMMDTWTPHTVDHAATYYQRRRGRDFKNIEKYRDMVFTDVTWNMSDPKIQERRGSYGDLEGGNFLVRQNPQRQHQISAEDLMTKKRARRHSTSESTATVIMKRNLKDSADINYEQLSDASPAERASRKLAKVVNGGISESRGMVVAFRENSPKHDGGLGSCTFHVDAMDLELPAKCNRKPAHLDSPTLTNKTCFPINTNFTSMASCGRRLSTIAEASQESTRRSSCTAPAAKPIPPTGRYNESLLNNTTCSPRLWKILHGVQSDDKSNDADNEKSEDI